MRQALAPRATVEGGIALLEVSGVLAYRPDLGEMFFDGFEDSAEVLSAFRHLEADPKGKAVALDLGSPDGFRVVGPVDGSAQRKGFALPLRRCRHSA